MKLQEVINDIKKICDANVLINEFGEGDIYEHLNSGEHKYPCVFLTINTISKEDDFMTLSGNLFYVDRLLQDNSNKLSIQSAGIDVLNGVLYKIEEKPYTVLSDTFNPFTEQFSDLCAGVFSSFQINYPIEDICYDVFYEN